MGPKTAYCGVCGASFTAKDANNDINPAEIAAAVQTYKQSVNDAFKGIVDAIKGVEPEAAVSVRVQGTTLVPEMENVCNQISSIKPGIANKFDDLPGKAQAKHDELQSGYNAEADAAAAACAASHPTDDGSSSTPAPVSR